MAENFDKHLENLHSGGGRQPAPKVEDLRGDEEVEIKTPERKIPNSWEDVINDGIHR